MDDRCCERIATDCRSLANANDHVSDVPKITHTYFLSYILAIQNVLVPIYQRANTTRAPFRNLIVHTHTRTHYSPSRSIRCTIIIIIIVVIVAERPPPASGHLFTIVYNLFVTGANADADAV